MTPPRPGRDFSTEIASASTCYAARSRCASVSSVQLQEDFQLFLYVNVFVIYVLHCYTDNTPPTEMHSCFATSLAFLFDSFPKD